MNRILASLVLIVAMFVVTAESQAQCLQQSFGQSYGFQQQTFAAPVYAPQQFQSFQFQTGYGYPQQAFVPTNQFFAQRSFGVGYGAGVGFAPRSTVIVQNRGLFGFGRSTIVVR